MEFAFSQNTIGELTLGLKAAKSHEVIEVNCLLSHKIINTIVHRLNFLCRQEKLPPYIDNSGFLRYANLRTSQEKGKLKDLVLEIITFPNAKFNPQLYEIFKILQVEFPEISGIVHAIRKNSLNIAYGETIVATFGKPYLMETLNLPSFNLSLKHNTQSFFQVNTFGSMDLYSSIVRLALSLKIKDICDIYCGVGGIGIAIAKAFKNANRPYSLYGLEVMKKAVNLAEENAKNAGIDAEFTLANASKLRQFLKNIKKPDIIILDPPRAGIDKQSLNIILKSQIEYILLVSCNPATLARDIAILNEYELIHLDAFDLFAHSSHVESLALLKRV